MLASSICLHLLAHPCPPSLQRTSPTQVQMASNRGGHNRSGDVGVAMVEENNGTLPSLEDADAFQHCFCAVWAQAEKYKLSSSTIIGSCK